MYNVLCYVLRDITLRMNDTTIVLRVEINGTYSFLGQQSSLLRHVLCESQHTVRTWYYRNLATKWKQLFITLRYNLP